MGCPQASAVEVSELKQEGVRKSPGLLLGVEEQVTVTATLRRVSCWGRSSGLAWLGKGGMKLLLTLPQGHQGHKGQKNVFNNSSAPRA